MASVPRAERDLAHHKFRKSSGSMEVCSPVYVSRMLNVPLEDVEKAMKEMGIV